MRADKDSSGMALWVIPVRLVVVFVALVDHPLKGICPDPFVCGGLQERSQEESLRAADVAL